MAMKAYIFSGPTLPIFKVTEALNVTVSPSGEVTLPNGGSLHFLPPVAEGDVWHLMEAAPNIIGVIDGYFENVPSVWHKEILFAMSRGVHVFGAASMGALRAAELSSFGMQGVGAIFNAFASGLLNDDDEVTVVHGPAELGFPQLSEAMVNIRRTFDDACAEGVITRREKDHLISIAKGIFYKKRTYSAIFNAAQQDGFNKTRIESLSEWLVEGRKDQKMMDALELVKVIANKVGLEPEPKQVLYNFKETSIWRRSRRSKINDKKSPF